jgi:hypothetical protein
MFAALVAIVGRRGPGIYLVAVDGDRDVRRPILGRAGHLRRKLHREFEPADFGVGKRCIVGELVLDEAAREPQESGPHTVRVEEGVGHVEKSDHAVLRAQAAGSRNLASRIKPKRHGHFYDAEILCRGALLEGDDQLGEHRIADLLAAFSRLLRFRLDQADIDENLDICGNRRLRQAKLVGHLIDVLRSFAVQEIENPNADLAREAFQQIEPL